jgi:hypothetical protein
MSPNEAVRLLRTVRYSPRRGRCHGIGWLARESGHSRQALYAVIRRGWCSRPMAQRLGVVFKNVNLSNGHIAFATVGPFDPDRDPRGRYPAGSGKRPRPWPRPVAGALHAEDIAWNSSSNDLQRAPLVTIPFQRIWARAVGGRKR